MRQSSNFAIQSMAPSERAGSRSRSPSKALDGRRATGSKKLSEKRASRTGTKAHAMRKEKMSVKVLLTQAGLAQYYPLFENAGYQMLEGNLNMSDMHAEQILADVERQNQRRFPKDVRTRLWKALRHMWFHLQAHDKPFIDITEVPKLFLPKPDYKQIDWMVKFDELDPDRQRQIVRHSKRVQTLQGTVVETQQFEVYKRQRDIWYEFKDMQRSVTEWTHTNARMMLREDPREEALKQRVRSIVDRAHIALVERHAVMATQRLILHILLGIRIVAACMVVLMLVVSYIRFRQAPVEILTHFMLSCRQFMSAISFVVVFAVAWVVSERRRDDPQFTRLKRLLTSCERLMQQLSDFRVETEEQRMNNAEAPKPAEVPPIGQRPAQQQQQKQLKQQEATQAQELKRRKKKKKREKDPMLQLWAPDLVKNKVDMRAIAEALPSMERALDPLPDHFRRGGGERMWRFTDRLGNRLAGVDEEQLALRVVGRPDKNAALPSIGFELPELPEGRPPSGGLPMPELPELPPISHRSNGSLPPRPSPKPLTISPARSAEALPTPAPGSTSRSSGSGSRSPARPRSAPLPEVPEQAQVLPGDQGESENAHDAASLYPWVPGAVASPTKAAQAGRQQQGRSPSPGIAEGEERSPGHSSRQSPGAQSRRSGASEAPGAAPAGARPGGPVFSSDEDSQSRSPERR